MHLKLLARPHIYNAKQAGKICIFLKYIKNLQPEKPPATLCVYVFLSETYFQFEFGAAPACEFVFVSCSVVGLYNCGLLLHPLQKPTAFKSWQYCWHAIGRGS